MPMSPEDRASFGQRMKEAREAKRAERAAAAGGVQADGATPAPAPAPEPEPKPRRRGLLKPSEPKEPKSEHVRPEVRLAKADTSEGLAMVYGWAGQVIAENDRRRGGLGSLGRSMMMTAPTAGRLLAEGAKKVPVLHNLLAALVGTGGGVRDASAVIAIPILLRRMEADPRTIPQALPIVRAQMRPVLRDMLKALKEEQKIAREIAELQREVGEQGGQPFDLDRMILVDMLGLPPDLAGRIIAGEPIEQVFTFQGEPGDPVPVDATVTG